MSLLKTFFLVVEVAIVVVVAGFFVIEGVSGNTALYVILLFLGGSSLTMLIGVFIQSRKQR